ncbi:hypothetical protein V8E54_005238 [Elaphomyces granulatus]
MAALTSLQTMSSSPALAPATNGRQMSASSPSPGTPGSVTTKEWIVPPRPKPGRKPAIDTPPTKRKAQNRAAQRAFRERRAARVGELEELIKKIEEEHESHEYTLKEQVENLSRDLEQCRQEVSWWKDRCYSLEKEVALERSAKLDSGSSVSHHATPQSDTSSDNTESEHYGTVSNLTDIREEQPEIPSGCGNCSSMYCQCIEDAFHIDLVDTQNSSSFNLHTSNKKALTRRRGINPAVKPEPEEMEIDFTSRFATPQLQENRFHSSTSPAAVDRCGFCDDGTACICEEMAAQSERQASLENNQLAPIIQNTAQFTPPPSDGDAQSDFTLPSLSQATSSCPYGPGTCAQCLADPRSTLFCKTLAASRAANGLSSGCCGSKGANRGCCQPRPSTRNSNAKRGDSSSMSTSTNPSLTLTCADTYTTLSRHPKFSRATDELATWLPKLQTHDAADNHLAARPAMEVEAASVISVLRYFDRRFSDK